jgi:isopentenyl phosphate kinase
MSGLLVVKLGGSAITAKAEEETLDAAALGAALDQLALLFLEGVPLIVAHGAGSFGHGLASRAGLARGGGADAAAALLAFAQTRASVLKLNAAVVAGLVSRGVPAVAVSPLPLWETAGGAVAPGAAAAAAVAAVGRLCAAGLVPVLHGDAVLDAEQRFAILSGDTLVAELCALEPDRVVYCTNVDGVYDRPPENPGAQLVARVVVRAAGRWMRVDGGDGGGEAGCGVDFNCAANDATGGMAKKVEEAAACVHRGCPDVYITRAGSVAALEACRGRVGPGWRGTHVCRE